MQTQDLAIPYHSGKASINSQHGTELEQENYTIQMLLELGLSQELIEREIHRLQGLLIEETSKQPDRQLEELFAYRQLLRLSGGISYDFLNLSTKEVQKISANVNESRTLQIELIHRYVLPEIEKYEIQLDADAQLFGMLFLRIFGMSGTVWNAETFTKLLKVIYPSTTAPEVINLLWSKAPESVGEVDVSGMQALDQKGKTLALLEQIYGRIGIKDGGLLDVAGLFRFVEDPLEIVRGLAKLECWKGTEIKGFGIHDKNGEFIIYSIENGQESIVPLSKSSLTKDEFVMFWRQQYAFGTDVKQAANQVAAMSVGRHTMIRDLMQGVLRLRDIFKGQNVNFFTSDEDREIIVSTLEKELNSVFDKNKPLTLRDILYYTVYTQSKRQGFDNYRSFKQKMHALLREKVYSVLLDPTQPLELLASMFSACNELFMSKQKQRPFELYGRNKSLEDKQKAVERDIEQMLAGSTMEAFRTHPLLKERFSITQIEQEVRALAADEMKHLPDQVMQSTYGKERSVQVELLQLKEKEMQLQQQLSVSYPKSPAALPEISWQKEGLYTCKYYTEESVNFPWRTAADISKNHRPVIGMQNLLSSYKATAEISSLFDPRLSVSLNYAPVFDSSWSKLMEGTSYIPSQKYQKETSYVLAIEDKKTNEINLMLVDDNDAEYFNQQFLEDKMDSENSPHREVRLSLYHFESGTTIKGVESINDQRFKDDPHCLRLIVQAKFFGGHTKYTDKELEQLESWLRETNAKTLHDFFMDKILQWKQESKDRYPGSSLHRLFAQVGINHIK